MARPALQQYRPISFALLDFGAPIATHDLVIRPEELDRTEPGRVTVHHTLGGAYADVWGKGIATITLEGTTGWRGTPTEDGQSRFKALFDTLDRWFELREAQIALGLDPSPIELVFSDSLNGYTDVVVPMEKKLRRNKSYPLLSKYSLKLTVLGPLSSPLGGLLDPITGAIKDAIGRVGAGLGSLGDAVTKLTGGAVNLAGLSGVLGSAASAGASFVSRSASVFGTLRDWLAAAGGVVNDTFSSLFSFSAQLAQAGRNLFRGIASLTSLPGYVRYQLQQISSWYHEVYCNLRNSFDLASSMFDLGDLWGASGCSSTGGGHQASAYQFSGSNALETMFPVSSTGSLASQESTVAMGTAARLDPLVTEVPLNTAAEYFRTITDGVLVA